jgi:hypothetical protein
VAVFVGHCGGGGGVTMITKVVKKLQVVIIIIIVILIIIILTTQIIITIKIVSEDTFTAATALLPTGAVAEAVAAVERYPHSRF